MNVLITGSGGREHALAWRLSQDSRVKRIFTMPGNPGMPGSQLKCDIDDRLGLLELIDKHNIDFTVIGPEAHLYTGVVDFLRSKKHLVFGPTKAAAELERNKVFSKDIMAAAGIPTADSKTFGNKKEAMEYIHELGGDCVVKAPGPALGKGAFVCRNVEACEEALDAILVRKEFGDFPALIEERLTGEEASFYVLTDGTDIFPLPAAQDHKTIFDGDQGPMTGGMGAFAPTPAVSGPLYDEILRTIVVPLLHAMRRRETPYTGVLFVGLMLTNTGPKVIEFNVRFGDPETQPLMMLWEKGLLDTLLATAGEGRLTDVEDKNQFYQGSATCVVMASAGYPETSTKGTLIEGLNNKQEDVTVFHAGTARDKDGNWITSGGRVLGVTARDSSLQQATDRAYEAVRSLAFEGCQYRTDIGHHALA